MKFTTIKLILITMLNPLIYVYAFDNNITYEEYKDFQLEKKEKLTLEEDYITQDNISSNKTADPANEFSIMYLYTTAAKNRVGGEKKIRENIHKIVHRLNQSFINSNMHLKAHIAHIEEVPYPLDKDEWINDKVMKKRFYDAVTHLEGKHDGYMDNIHTLRDRYKADFVQLFIANAAFGGLANVMTVPSKSFENQAFSVVTAKFMGGPASIHELGHNMGICHTDCTGAYPYANGYNIGEVGTIHGKNNINYWSSPTLQYHGVTIGDSQHDARKAILNTAPYFCNFRTKSSSSTIETISFNNNKNGSWSSNENSNHKNGSYAKYYKFTLSKSTKVTIDLKSSTDAYMFLLSGDSKTGSIITKDDDGGDGRNSKIVKTLNAGTYTIEATTYAAGQTGSFTVRVNTKSTNVAKKSEIISPSYNTNVNSGQDFTLRWQTHGADKHRLEVYVAGYRIMNEDNIYGSSKTITIPSNRSGSVGIYLHSYAKNKSLGHVRHQLKAVSNARKSEIISPSYNTNVNSGQDFTLRWQTHGADKHRLEVYVAGYRIMNENNIYGSSKTITIPSNRSGSVGIYLHSYAKNKSLGQVRHQLRAH